MENKYVLASFVIILIIMAIVFALNLNTNRVFEEKGIPLTLFPTRSTSPTSIVSPTPIVSLSPTKFQDESISTFSAVTELKIEDIKIGTGEEVRNGDTVTVHYTGRLTNGTVFDSSVGRQPFTTRIGEGQVIEGWDKGILGMKVGGIRRLVIPPDLAYGQQGAGSIPPNATLVFDIELLKIN